MNSSPTCAQVRTQLSARHDGELFQLDDVSARHLDGCPACEAFGHGLVGLGSLLDPLRHADLPAGLFPGGQQGGSPAFPLRRLLPLAASLLGFATVFGLGNVLQSRTGDGLRRLSSTGLPFVQHGGLETLPEHQLLSSFGTLREDR